jgi:hypothetical protein
MGFQHFSISAFSALGISRFFFEKEILAPG